MLEQADRNKQEYRIFGLHSELSVLSGLCRVLHPTTAEDTFKCIKNIFNILSQKEIIDKFQSIKIIQCMFLVYNAIKLELNGVKITRNITCVLKLRTMHLIDFRVKE